MRELEAFFSNYWPDWEIAKNNLLNLNWIEIQCDDQMVRDGDKYISKTINLKKAIPIIRDEKSDDIIYLVQDGNKCYLILIDLSCTYNGAVEEWHSPHAFLEYVNSNCLN
jgi:hypothetical protein